jgi:hypothetical protein
MDFYVSSLQTAIFIPNLDLSNKIGFINQLNKETGNLFDGDPIILPIPNDAPPEVPRIILKNKNDSYTLNLCQNRVDLFYNERDLKDFSPTHSLSELIPDMLDKSNSLIQSLKKLMSVRIVRLGFIVALEGITLESASIYLKELFIKEKPLVNKIYDLNIEFLKKQTINSINSNIWFKVKPIRIEGDARDDKIISVRFDINTEADEFLNIDIKDAYNYLVAASSYIENNLTNYLED